MGDLEAAEDSFERSLEAAPGYENGFFRLGVVRERRGDPAGAERAFADGLRRNPRSSPLAYRLAIVRSSLGRPSAEADWRRAVENSRGAAAIRFGYADWLRSKGRTSEAAREAREVLRRRPGEVAALRLLADSSRRQGRRFAEGLAVEQIVRATRSLEDYARLVAIAGEDPAYAKRFRDLSDRLNPRRRALPELRGGDAAGARR